MKGLTAVWREGLLAQKVLQGGTRGYRYHPQLQRFRLQPHPVAAVAAYLFTVWVVAERRGYHFDRTKLAISMDVPSIPVTRGQMRYEWEYLLGKLLRRDPERYQELIGIVEPEPHPLFTIVNGDVEIWEAIR